jgi:hypothetical protein
MSTSLKIIGICGQKFNGKDTIADYLVSNYGFTKISLGDPVKHALQEIFCFSYEQLWGVQKEITDSFWKVTPREMMQYFGTECLRIKFGTDYPHIGNNIWVLALHRKIDELISKGITKIVVPDLRFPNEEKPIRDFGGCVLKVIRKKLVSGDSHASENSLEHINVDHVIYNETIEQLFKDVDDVVKKI